MNNQNKSLPGKTAQYRKKRKKAKRKGKFIAGLFFFLVFYFVFCLIYVFGVALSIRFRRTETPPHSSDIKLINYSVDSETGKVLETQDFVDFSAVKKIARSEGTAYIPASAFEFLGADITRAGDPVNNVTIILNGVDEWASFGVDSQKATVNGTSVTLGAKAVIEDDELYIPFEFFETGVDGITIEKDRHTCTIKNDGTKQISFYNKPAQTTPYIEESRYFNDLPIKFRADLYKYEQYMNPENRDDFLYLVNTSNLLSEDFVPENLRNVEYTKPDRDKQKMCLNAQMAADAMMIEARKYGFSDLWVTSAYRSYKTQSWLYQEEVESLRDQYGDNAEQEAKKSVNPPGASEHQSGLTADIHNRSTASMKFAGTSQAKWLEENCQYFGFILRYPEDKTEITGIMYEPWHFRYVGRFHAMRMYELDMCLEEYIQYLNK
ncbi:MAG: D-alanyl-D-alanine carboxypeptidase family protein [Clostridia bacterium]|nr:D-alanyl-D-alanine carboxypeptidase family protein [Clostridia bacterium]